MSGETPESPLAQRIVNLYASDPQFAAARPIPAVTAVAERHGLPPAEIMRTVMEGYSDRPALGQRAVEVVTDPYTGRATLRLLPRFETITYSELGDRVAALTSALSCVRPRDRICILGFSSVEYTVIDMTTISLEAVSVPLQANAPAAQLRLVVTETQPTVIASSIDHVDDAVELALTGHMPKAIIVFDYRPEIDDQREAYDAARGRLADASGPVVMESLDELLDRGKTLPAAQPAMPDNDAVALLIYTSGSTGAPKGAIYTQRLFGTLWQPANWGWLAGAEPSISLSFMPMSHVMGRHILYGTLTKGGTTYFAAKSDLSTLLEDLALVRPTELNMVPRLWDMLFQTFQTELARRSREGLDAEDAIVDVRKGLLGERYVSAITGGAPISSNLKAWVESFLGLHLWEGYGATETGPVFLDGCIRRPPVIDYKLVDVPQLGYFRTDRPHPRGELALKTTNMFGGYYKRPQATADAFDSDGFYRTGDIMAELSPGQLRYVDRRNFVLKLSQGEFVSTSKLEAVFETSPLVHQIYIYGNGERSYLLAVIVPTAEELARHNVAELRPLLGESLHDVARTASLQSYEIPRDFIIETAPFTVENGLLTGIRKLARPKLKEAYGAALEDLYKGLADGQTTELQELRQSSSKLPLLEIIGRAAGALLGAAAADLQSDVRFTDLGGDSLSAVTFADLLRELFDVDVPVSVIVSPASDLGGVADYIEAELSGSKRPTFAAVHGRGATEVHAVDLTLDKFINAQTLAAATSLPGRSQDVRTILLTGATGFLGRYLALECLQRMSVVNGKVICLVRAKDDASARNRLDETFDSGDPILLEDYRRLAADRLQVITGDKSKPALGVDEQTWNRLAQSVDLIVDAAAMVNHILPYDQLFGPNVVGTAELIRLALTTRIKPFVYVSTVGVSDQIDPTKFTEDADVRDISATRNIDNSYANGYGNSKWAGEVLLREAHDLSGLPVSVFRCDMILAETKHIGQLNLPDMVTRLLLSLVATGIAPGSFYELDATGNRQRAHYDGLPVDFIAEAIITLGVRFAGGYETYHVLNPHDDGLGLDEYVDWLIDLGYSIERIADYKQWLSRFETVMRALPDKQRQASVLPLLHSYDQPARPTHGAFAPNERFRTAVRELKIGPGGDIPHVTPDIIGKYITDLELFGLLQTTP